MALRNKQRVFIEEYLKDWNATQAALRAGYSAKTAYSIGQENLNKPEIKAVIEARIAEKTMSADEVLLRLADQARASFADFLTNGDLDLGKAERSGKLHLVKNYAVSDKGAVRIELHDAQAALVQLGRYHGLFVDKQEISGSLGVSIDDYNAAKRRAEKDAHSG